MSMIILNKSLDRGTRNPQGDNPMHFRRLLRQTLPTVATVFAAACLLAASAQSAFAQTGGGGSTSSSSGSSLLGSSSGIGTGSGSGASSGSLLGSSGTSGGSLLGGTGTSSLTGTSLSGSSTATNYRASTNGVGPSATNIVAPYYANPLQAGMPNTSSTTGNTASNKPFGSTLFDTLNTSNNTASVSRNTNSNGSGLASVAPTNTIRVGPRYSQSLGWKVPIMASARMQTELQSVISGSQRLVNPRDIQVSVDGQTVVLRGTAADEHERALAGAIISMSPGVYDIRNEIKVQTPVVTPPSVTPAGQRP
jgi:hypothetical protein